MEVHPLLGLTSPPESYLRPHTRVPVTPQGGAGRDTRILSWGPIPYSTTQTRRLFTPGLPTPGYGPLSGFHTLSATTCTAHPPDHYFRPERSWGSPPQRFEPSGEQLYLIGTRLPSCRSLPPPLPDQRSDNSRGRDFRALLPPVSRTAPTPTRRQAQSPGTDAPVVQPLQSPNPPTRRPHPLVASSPHVLL